MPILTYSAQPHGLIIQSDSGWLLLSPYSASLVRIRYNQDGNFSQRPGPIVTAKPAGDAMYKVSDAASSLAFSTSCITILIDRKTLAFSYLDSQGNLLAKEPRRGGKTLEPVDVYLSNFQGATTVNNRDSADGVRIDVENYQRVFDCQAFHTKLEFEWEDKEALYGSGSHEEGMFNLRGQHQCLYQQNQKVVIPVLVSTKGYGIFLDSCSLITFHDDAFGSHLWSDVDDELDYYFAYGPDFDQIIAQLRWLTGQSPMLPRWAFGYLQSKERYTSQAELLAVSREYRSRNLPPWIDTVKSWYPDIPVYGSQCEANEYLTRIIGARNYLLWIATYPEEMGRFITRLNEWALEMLKAQIKAADGLIDGIVIWGDVAYRKDLFFAPDYWRQWYKPGLKAMVQTCHEAGLPVIYHGCGNVKRIFADFIELGIDSYNPLEAKAGMDVVELRRQYGHKIGFCGNMNVIDWANLSKEELKPIVLRKLNAAKGGGMIFQSDHSVPSNVSAENYEYVINLVREYGQYPLNLGEYDIPDLK